MKAPRSKSRRVVSKNSRIAINSNYLIIFFVFSCLFAAFQCDAKNVVAPCRLYGLHISWIYRYPTAILCLMRRSINEFFMRILFSPYYLLKLILCFFKALILPILTWLYYSFFAPVIKVFEGLRYLFKSMALTFPRLFIIPLYILRVLLSPFKYIVSRVSPFAYNECRESPLKCIGHQTAHIFYIPIRGTDKVIKTVDDWYQILLDLIRGRKPDEDLFDTDKNNTLLDDELRKEERKRREDDEQRRKEEERKRREDDEQRRKEDERKRRENDEQRRKEDEQKRREEDEQRRKEEERKRREEEERNKKRVHKDDYNDLVKRYDRAEKTAERANQFTHEKIGCTKEECDK